MAPAVVELLPRHAELARRAAGGDGAAFVRLYAHYSTEVFATALAATGDVDAAADATQAAFLRILRWPPRLGAPDADVEELLYALALGGQDRRQAAGPQELDIRVARMVGVGWLRSETVAKAGARFDADWSVHLWSPVEGQDESAREDEVGAARARRLRRPPRLRISIPSPAAAAAVPLVFLAGFSGTLLIGGGSSAQTDAAPASATSERTSRAGHIDRRPRAEIRAGQKARRSDAPQARLLRDDALRPLLAP